MELLLGRWIGTDTYHCVLDGHIFLWRKIRRKKRNKGCLEWEWGSGTTLNGVFTEGFRGR